MTAQTSVTALITRRCCAISYARISPFESASSGGRQITFFVSRDYVFARTFGSLTSNISSGPRSIDRGMYKHERFSSHKGPRWHSRSVFPNNAGFSRRAIDARYELTPADLTPRRHYLTALWSDWRGNVVVVGLWSSICLFCPSEGVGGNIDERFAPSAVLQVLTEFGVWVVVLDWGCAKYSLVV